MNDVPAIKVRRLTKRFGKLTAVDGVSLDVYRGEVFGFLGPNGSGKTTTIRMICGLLTPDDGEGTCLGFDVMTQSGEIKKRIGYMTQQFSLYEELTVAENLRFIARMYNIKDARGRAAETVRTLGLEGRGNQMAETLSGGWKQRLALGAAMMHDPELLLLDEPTAGVDPKARREFWDEIHKLAESGITVLVSTHYMDEAERCHRLAYLSRGKLLASGTGPELIKASGLVTWRGRGKHLDRFVDQLTQKPAVFSVAPFGSALHVSGQDSAALQQALTQTGAFEAGEWREVEPNLEDVFIQLMSEKRGEAA